MSRADVVRAIGKPDGDQIDGEKEVLTYANRMMSGWSGARTNYYVVLQHGAVLQYGPQAIDFGPAAQMEK